jgi:hypothetical protein
MLGALVHPRADAAHAPEIGARSLNLRKILLVGGEVCARGGVLGRDALLAQLGGRPDEVRQDGIRKQKIEMRITGIITKNS